MPTGSNAQVLRVPALPPAQLCQSTQGHPEPTRKVTESRDRQRRFGGQGSAAGIVSAEAEGHVGKNVSEVGGVAGQTAAPIGARGHGRVMDFGRNTKDFATTAVKRSSTGVSRSRRMHEYRQCPPVATRKRSTHGTSRLAHCTALAVSAMPRIAPENKPPRITVPNSPPCADWPSLLEMAQGQLPTVRDQIQAGATASAQTNDFEKIDVRARNRDSAISSKSLGDPAAML